MSSTLEKNHVGALAQAIEAIAADPDNGKDYWQVTSRWRGGTRSDACSRLPIGSLGFYAPFSKVALSANVLYQQNHQHVTCFPWLLSAFGERAFTTYWALNWSDHSFRTL